jgi:3-phosphoshikimate 1-carboxyvinyltransferase
MQGCLAALGVQIEHPKVNETTVDGGRLRSPDHTLDCLNSGTTMRLMLGALAGSQVSATLTGSPRLVQRPMARVVAPLRRMGADITGLNGSDQPPLSIVGSRLRGIEHEMQVASAQVKTAILLAGLRAEGATILREPAPSRDHSERMLRQLGVSVSATNGNLRLEPIQAPLPAFELSVPGDLSSAAFVLAAALLVPGSQVVLERVGLNPTRTGLIEVLDEMGAQIASSPENAQNGEPVGNLTAGYSELAGIEVGADRVVSMIDEIPIFAVIATQAHGETRVRGAAELRLKESDRLATITHELRKMGARIEEHTDGIAIEGPTPMNGAHVSAHGDHRIAMALSIAGVLGSGETTISNVEVIKQSFPDFVQTLQSIGVVLQ